MIELDAFLQGQQEVYAKLVRNAPMVQVEGTTPPKTAQERDGYLVIVKHPQDIVELCTRFSRKIAQAIPAVVYEGNAIHTTLSVVDMNYRGAKLQGQDSAKVILLEEALHSVCSEFQALQITYSDWLFDTGTTLAQGIAKESFIDIANVVHGSFQKYNVLKKVGKVQRPWGGHITVSRILERTPGDQLQDYFKVVRSEPILPPSLPEAVYLGYVSVKKGVIALDVLEEFPLPK